MLSALSDFFAFAFLQGQLHSDPLRSLKYRRSPHAIAAQMDFFSLLAEAGISADEIGGLVWEDFVTPTLRREEGKLRVAGRLVDIEPYLWNRLEVRFRDLARASGLKDLLGKAIV